MQIMRKTRAGPRNDALRTMPIEPIESADDCKSCDPEPFYVNDLQQHSFTPPGRPLLAGSSSSIQFMAWIGRTVDRMAALERAEPASCRWRERMETVPAALTAD